ncbi:MAG: hypothetical protein EA346_10230 [Thioalkalivibrio sp.]|nr:MAG: hypothetical protein EA346_10230 [Thioalkalivibrio sp.]
MRIRAVAADAGLGCFVAFDIRHNVVAIVSITMPGMSVMCCIGACRSMGGMGPVRRMIHASMLCMPSLRKDRGVGRSRADPGSEPQCAQ